MRVDVIDLTRLDGRVVEGDRCGPRRLAPVGARLDHVVGIRGRAVPEHLGVGPRASTFGRFRLLEDQQCRALAHDEAVPLRVEGPCRVSWVVVVSGRRAPG